MTMRDFQYCPMCKGVLIQKHIDERIRKICSLCGWINYRNPVPVIACLVSNDNGDILLIKRAIEPCIGAWAIPGGFIEIDEDIKTAGVRELKEETGLQGIPGRIVGVHLEYNPIYDFVLVIGMEFLIDTFQTVKAGDDASDAKFIPRTSLPQIPFESHRKLIADFCDTV
ncbi:NUDIX hydrolase [Candidatus Omnitrophus magneticus]|uniref:NUDIX hydrolase n=1 Tax=Candidatus Omnitrophus magneticus TaxID=1609969 RepID=A0A0F0CPR4_9BACT|nr:NUDIX hydrolase [Candidatus Omnitrophus magneticus]